MAENVFRATQNLPRVPACPFHWSNRHPCKRDPTTRICRDCRPHVTRIRVGGGVKYAPEFYDSAAHAELFKHVGNNSLPSLDIDVGSHDFNVLTLQITTCSGRTSKLCTFRIEEGYNTGNKSLMEQLDTMVLECLTISLDDSDPFSKAIHRVILAGGYVHLLCSTVKAKGDDIQTIRDGDNVQNDFARYNLHRHFQYLVVCRLNELFQQALTAIRFEDVAAEYPTQTTDAFASAAVLKHELDYFMRHLRNGHLSRLKHMPKGFKDLITAWFSTIEHELSEHLRLGCGRFANWQDSIAGSKKLSRRQAQKLTLVLTLAQFKHTNGEPPPTTSPYTASGSGRHFLLSSPGSPILLAVPGLSFIDSPGEIEQIPSHVSGPLSFDTWEETSVSWISDLFPDLHTTIRFC